jgi:hypothetical protein
VRSQDDPLPETWTTRELPLLRSALRHIDAGEYYVDVKTVQAEAQLSDAQLRGGLIALEGANPPFLTVQWLARTQSEGHIKDISERTRRLLHTWPTADDVLARLIDALEDRADHEADPAQGSKFRDAARFIGGTARNVLVAVLSQRIGTL